MDVIENMPNPFKHSYDLTSLSTGVMATDDTKRDHYKIHIKGEQSAKQFRQERIISQAVPFCFP